MGSGARSPGHEPCLTLPIARCKTQVTCLIVSPIPPWIKYAQEVNTPESYFEHKWLCTFLYSASIITVIMSNADSGENQDKHTLMRDGN